MADSQNRSAAFAELERSVLAALKTYANVHRGSGHNSMVTTALFEQARVIVLNDLGLNDGRHEVIFRTPRGAAHLLSLLASGSCRVVSSRELGLPLGVRAIAAERKALPHGAPDESGGGTVKIVSPRSEVWADAPDKFEPGTPAVINIIALAKALQIRRALGRDVFLEPGQATLDAAGILQHDGYAGHSGRELLLKLREAVVGRGTLIPTAQGLRPLANFDNAASTRTFSPVWDAVCRVWQQPEPVRQEVIGMVKDIAARFLGAPREDYEILFTGNTTEAIAIAAQALVRSEQDIETVVLNTTLEHNSNELPWRRLPGVRLARLAADDDGFIDLDDLEGLLREYNIRRAHGRKRIRLVAMSGASNVLGTCNDMRSASALAHRYGARLLVDAAQLVAHRRVDMERSGIDALAFSGHKMHAPFGSGALVIRKGLVAFSPAEWASLQTSGEENAAGVAALGKAMVLLQRVGRDVIEEEERALTVRTLHKLSRVPGLKTYGLRDPLSPRFQEKTGNIVFSLKNVPHNKAAKELAEEGGIGVRNGCFCAHILLKRLLRIHPLRARLADLGLLLFPKFTSKLLPGLVRISLGIENDEQDVDHLSGTLQAIAARPRTAADKLIEAAHSGTPVFARTEVQIRMEEFTALAMRRVYSLPPEQQREFTTETLDLLRKGKKRFRCCALSAE